MRRVFVVLIVSHYLRAIFLQKNYNYMFEFIKVMPTYGRSFFPGHGVFSATQKTNHVNVLNN